MKQFGRPREDIIQKLDQASRLQMERVRETILERGGQTAVEAFDRDMKGVENGRYQARNTWHSLSPTQRKIVEILATEPGSLVRNGKTLYDLVNAEFRIEKVARLRTVRALAERRFLEWQGGVFDPEAKCSFTERGRFVFKHRHRVS